MDSNGKTIGNAVKNECEFLSTCGFFKKYNQSKKLACKGFISRYCKGDLQEACKRKAYLKANGVSPSDDMMPNGQPIA